jgi:hypothetical protein
MRCRSWVSIKTYLKFVFCEGAKYFKLPQVQWRAVLNTLRNQVPQKARNFLTSWPTISLSIRIPFHGGEKRCSFVVRALCYKPEGRGFETRWGEWMVLIYLILPAALGPGVHSASNRNEYEKQKNNCFWRVKCGRSVGLTTLPPSEPTV